MDMFVFTLVSLIFVTSPVFSSIFTLVTMNLELKKSSMTVYTCFNSFFFFYNLAE